MASNREIIPRASDVSLTFNSVFTSLSPEEKETVSQEWKIVGEALSRKVHLLEDDMAIAASVLRIRDKHGHTSNIYLNYLAWLKDIDAGWQDKQARLKKLKAYKGLERLKAVGSPEEAKVSASKFESQASLAEITSKTDVYELAKKLQRRSKPVTAGEMKAFNKTGKFDVSHERPQIDKPELSEDDKVLLLNLYISHYLKKRPLVRA